MSIEFGGGLQGGSAAGCGGKAPEMWPIDELTDLLHEVVMGRGRDRFRYLGALLLLIGLPLLFGWVVEANRLTVAVAWVFIAAGLLAVAASFVAREKKPMTGAGKEDAGDHPATPRS
jgi:hypothetical protein